MPHTLNQRAQRLSDELVAEADHFRVGVTQNAESARIVDCGIQALGGLEAGRRLSEICLAGLGHVSFVPATAESGCALAVAVRSDQPVAACMASQYAGWKLAEGKFFAMGSGP